MDLDRKEQKRNFLNTWDFLAITFFVICLFSGLFLLAYYIPTFAQAFSSVLAVEERIPFGWLIRRLHGTSAGFLLLILGLRLGKVFYKGEYKNFSPYLWVIRVILVFLAVGGNFTGFFLPLSQEAFWGTAATLSNFSSLLGGGSYLVDFLRGGKELGGIALNRFFSLHLWLAALIAIFLFLSGRGEFSQAAPERRSEEDSKFWFAAGASGLFLGVITFLPEWFIDLLQEPAQPLNTPPIISVPWYFQALREFLPFLNSSYPFFSFFLLLGFLLLLFLLPYFDRNPEKKILKRPIAFSLSSAFLVIYIYFSILGLRGVKYEQMVVLPSPADSLAEIKGARIYAEKNCAFCHQINGRYGRREGPDMTVLGPRKRSPDWLQRFIFDAHLYKPGTTMPRYDLPLADLEALQVYLLALNSPNKKWQRVPRDIFLELEPTAWLSKKESP